MILGWQNFMLAVNDFAKKNTSSVDKLQLIFSMKRVQIGATDLHVLRLQSSETPSTGSGGWVNTDHNQFPRIRLNSERLGPLVEPWT
jgi:hypothetical protein